MFVLGGMVRENPSSSILYSLSPAWSAGVDKWKFVIRMISFFLYWCSQAVSNNDVLPHDREWRLGHIGRLDEQRTSKRPSPKTSQIGMNENGGLSVRLKAGGSGGFVNPWFGPATVSACRHRHITPGLSDNVYKKLMLMVTVTSRNH